MKLMMEFLQLFDYSSIPVES